MRDGRASARVVDHGKVASTPNHRDNKAFLSCSDFVDQLLRKLGAVFQTHDTRVASQIFFLPVHYKR